MLQSRCSTFCFSALSCDFFAFFVSDLHAVSTVSTRVLADRSGTYYFGLRGRLARISFLIVFCLG